MRTINRFLVLVFMLGSVLGTTGCVWDYYHDDWGRHGDHGRDHHDRDHHDRDWDHRDRDRDHHDRD